MREMEARQDTSPTSVVSSSYAGTRFGEEEPEDDDDQGSFFLGCLADPSVPTRVASLAFLIVLAAVVTSYFGVSAAAALLSAPSTVSYQAPLDSPSKVADLQVWKDFPKLARASVSQVALAIKSEEGSVLNAAVESYCLNVSQNAVTDMRVAILQPSVTSYYTGNMQLGLQPKDEILRSGLVSPDEHMTLMLFVAEEEPQNVNLAGWQVRENVVAFMQEMVALAPPNTVALITGNPIIDHEAAADRSVEMLLKAEMCTIPVAVCILACLVKRLRLLIIPLVTLIVTFLAACLGVTIVTWATPNFSTDIPPAMVSVTIALSLDYSLFFLTRFNENAKLGMRLMQNVEVMVSNVAHTISISGLLIAVAFFGALTIPELNLQVAGICLGITTIACLTVNALLTPSLLLLFGRLLTLPLRCSNKDARDSDVNEEALLSERRSEDMRSANGKMPITISAGEGRWLALMQRVERRPLGAVALVLLIFSPVIAALPWLYATGDAYQLLPASLPSISALREIQAAGFPAGRLEPFLVEFRFRAPQDMMGLELLPEQSSAMMSPPAFNAMLEASDRIFAMKEVASVLGPTWLMNERVDWNTAKSMLTAVAPAEALKKRTLYEMVLSMHVKDQAAVLQVHTHSPSKSSGAGRFIEEIRDILQEWNEKNPSILAQVSGGGSPGLDIRDVVLAAMPVYLGTTILGVTLLVVLMFRSLLLPVRLAFALLFTLAATFGIAIIIYQTPLLHSFFPDLANYYGLSYSSVPISTCIAIALGLDYDIFLISRIVEYRQLGFTDADAISYGVAKTGGIISGAGMIMALAFSGLLFAPKEMLQQFAMLLITSVLLDTFVVRTVFVPALMFSAGEWNWWPRKMPQGGTIRPYQVDEESDGDDEEGTVGTAED
eukprot:TRINITY_DN54736_c0_g1_i1.p1 TRINITY_DN54736_c0_g1~~TRINITY_DN54736_c0_g1_i1.p1  ORF type:complete len:891 (+),score=165.45 TRINITY_DN54736_c0_g1_i1:72-2744(+)